MGTTTPPACSTPKIALMNSGQFFSQRPTRSCGRTPKSSCRRAANQQDCVRSLSYEYSEAPQKTAVFPAFCSADAAKAVVRFMCVTGVGVGRLNLVLTARVKPRRERIGTMDPSPCPLPARRGEGGRRPGEGRFMESFRDFTIALPNHEPVTTNFCRICNKRLPHVHGKNPRTLCAPCGPEPAGDPHMPAENLELGPL